MRLQHPQRDLQMSGPINTILQLITHVPLKDKFLAMKTSV